MTELRKVPLRRDPPLPSGRGLDLLVRWATRGPASLAPSTELATDGQRYHAVSSLRRVAEALDVPAPELRPVRGRHRDFSLLSDDLLTALAARARSYGCVTAGCRARVPLSPNQTDALYRLTWGATLTEIARDTGRRNSSAVSGTLKRARERLGVATDAQLVACAFRNHWFPDQEELGVLGSGRMVWCLPTPYYGPNRPPYTWTDDS